MRTRDVCGGARLAGLGAGLAFVFLVVVAAPGCGGEEETSVVTTTTTSAAPSRLTPGERQHLSAYEERIVAHCVSVSRSLVNPRAAPSPSEEKRAFGAADQLVALMAAKPTARVAAGQDLRLFVSDVAENLEGSNCDPQMITRLEEGLAQVEP